MAKRVLVFGASGRTGREVVKRGLDRGYEVTAFTRHPESFPLDHANLQVVEGQITSYADVETAVARHTVVISTLGPHSLLRRIPELTRGCSNIVESMQRTGVKRLVYTSALGVGDSIKDQNAFFRYILGPVLLGRDYADHLENEKKIKSSNLDWVIVRPVRLTMGEKRGGLEVDEHLSATFPFGRISRADTAEFLLDQIAEDEYVHRCPGVMTHKALVQ